MTLATTRRTMLSASLAAPFAGGALAAGPATGIAADLDRYVGFGNKAAGGDGDNACGEWLAAALLAQGFAIARQTVSVPWFAADRAEVACNGTTAPVWPQPIVVPTGTGGVTGRLVRIDGFGQASGDLAGAIALIDLPFARWSTAVAPPIKGPVEAAFRQGAQAAIIITNGPTGRIIRLNGDGRNPMFAGPVALLAPADARPLLAAALAGQPATLIVTGQGGRRPAFNFVGRLDRGKPQWVVVSTPRSGWDICAGERGPGVAVWLDLARWARAALPGYNLAFVCNTGHEYEYLGSEQSLKAMAPHPEDTRFWLHLGANVAARDWHDWPGAPRPLPGVDPQRYLVVTPTLLDTARAVFAGLPGLEMPYSSETMSAGELTGVLQAGYRTVAGVFGVHRYHHVEGDDARCLVPDKVADTALAFRTLLTRALAGAA
jgi:hypothetical protein